jgi:hypothetical protein
MTTDALTEEEVYSLIVTGDLSRSVSLDVIRAYGNRKAIEALERARELIPGTEQTINEREAEERFTSCIEKLDQFVRLSIEAVKQGASE